MQKKQPTENQKNTKYQNVRWRGPVFTVSLPGGATRPSAPRQLRQWSHETDVWGNTAFSNLRS